MVRPICFDGHNEVVKKKKDKDRTDEVGRGPSVKKRGKISTKSFPSANIWTKEELFLPMDKY